MKEETFESALEKLEVIIKELESGEVDLDNSIKKYKEAMDLLNFCNKKLEEATTSVNKIINKEGEEVEFEPAS